MSSTARRLWVVAAALLAVLAGPGRARPEAPNEARHCPNCYYHAHSEPDPRDLHTLRIEGIKQQILSKLGLRAKPNVTYSIPRDVLMQTLYRSQEDNELVEQPEIHALPEEDGLVEDDYYAKTSEIISFAEPGPQVNNHTLLEFTQSDADVGSLRVTEAMLWVYLRRRPGARHHGSEQKQTIPRLWAFRIPPDPREVSQNPYAEMLTSLNVTQAVDGWRRLNLTSAVQRWFARAGERLRLLVDCSNCGGEFEAALFSARKRKGAHKPGSRRAEASHRPFLVVHTAPTPSRRLSRRALQCDNYTEMCCKQELSISFVELGWDDWIIAPSGYKANYCKGSCDSVYRTPDSFTNFHGHILEEYRRHHPPGSLTQCCAPTKLSPMSLIYVDEYSNIIKRDVPRMVVEECGCA